MPLKLAMEFSELAKVDRQEKPAAEEEEEQEAPARHVLAKRQLSEHIKRFYSLVKRVIIILALVSFVVSTTISIFRAVLATNGGANPKQDIVSEVQKHLERLLQLTDLALASPGGASVFRVGTVLGINTVAAE